MFNRRPVMVDVAIVIVDVAAVAGALTPTILRHSTPDSENTHQQSTNQSTFHFHFSSWAAVLCPLEVRTLEKNGVAQKWLRRVRWRSWSSAFISKRSERSLLLRCCFGAHARRRMTAYKDRRSLGSSILNYQLLRGLRPPITLAGRKMMAFTNSSTPSTAMPRMRNGNMSSQTIG